ncbi:MAG: hypothetical protein KDA28_17615, partial [Phycisphaerales bacterium]|nr:hypothetical protein [Phycisphaerales bacterium]
MRRPLRRSRILLLPMLMLGACSSGPDERLAQLVSTGDLDRARARILDSGVSKDRSDRDYVLDRMRLALVDLADGWPRDADRTLTEVYDILRLQGVNRDNTTAAVVVNEDVRYWKGEPFEQALAYHYMALVKGMLGDFGNMRAASGQSLFLLKDFGDAEGGGRRSTLDLARNAAEDDDYLDAGYTPSPTDFALGYVMAAIANLVLDRTEEASDQLRTATSLAPGLAPLAERLERRDWNTILVVDDGMGPAKTGYGPDNAIAAFVPRTRRSEPLSIVRDDQVQSWADACDVGAMAADHMWNNLE